MARRRTKQVERSWDSLLEPGAADTRAPLDPIESLVLRARKARSKGDARRGLVLLREAALLDEHNARVHTLLGVHAVRAGRVDEGARALKHARWLRARGGERARARSTAELLDRLVAPAAA